MPQTTFETAQPTPQGPETRPSLLLVDDEPDLSHFLREYLTSIGYEVTAAPDGVEGLKQVAQRDFDIILSDLLMPKMQGNVFYRKLEAIKPYLCERFIIMTGHHTDPEVLQFLRTMRGLTLFKPIEMSLLDDALALLPRKIPKRA
jgi:DNA-binding response OmpR family regulator